MLKKEILPIGSIVYLKESLKKVMITSRMITIQGDETEEFYDYGGVAYPEGMRDENILAFNVEDITDVKFRGFSDDDELELVKRMREWQSEELGISLEKEDELLEL
ncbi:DUF4176 domain-containing protein [Listeria seeligeri]|uniref:DUF4176 domain-containing protein n=1 Tax=Listeria seeligeri TaxID=1640 RepID=UPI001625A5CE|nr:DUF4176 domain-containing protein [Listeria seeligeri]MBC1528613.1 DUF4176 domain-containing protein [Listeria seeligeri]MBC1765361.1 DUF4176 domain-containing protein [Listeria seeligeri]MBC1883164.1 DUF4176 domain-containing protein [Listeria seeligeri]MBC2203370.1 DUF4176 domain-containing protein [Listeria seeligeri]MBF2421434.1 DUF4176 domain-containing protein [Listeria seeligeri]